MCFFMAFASGIQCAAHFTQHKSFSQFWVWKHNLRLSEASSVNLAPTAWGLLLNISSFASQSPPFPCPSVFPLLQNTKTKAAKTKNSALYLSSCLFSFAPVPPIISLMQQLIDCRVCLFYAEKVFQNRNETKRQRYLERISSLISVSLTYLH